MFAPTNNFYELTIYYMKRTFLGLVLSLGLVGAIHLDASAQVRGYMAVLKPKMVHQLNRLQ